MAITLDEAIKHLQDSLNDETHKWTCKECKEEHEQLLNFLLELKELRGERDTRSIADGIICENYCLQGKIGAYREIFKMIIGGDN